MKFRCKFRHRRLIRRPRFPSRVQNFGVLATFQFIFAFYMLNVAIFLLPVCLTYWPRKNTTRVGPHVDNSHQVWSRYDHQLPSYIIAFLSADTSRDLVTSTFDLLTLNSWRTWRATWPTLPPSLKTLRISVLESSFTASEMTYTVSGGALNYTQTKSWIQL